MVKSPAVTALDGAALDTVLNRWRGQCQKVNGTQQQFAVDKSFEGLDAHSS
jgi:hypothetical protein